MTQTADAIVSGFSNLEVSMPTGLDYNTAIEFDDVETVRFCIGSGNTIPNLADLSFAISGGCAKVTKLLLETGLDANKCQESAIVCAVKSNQVNILELLLDNGARVGIDDALCFVVKTVGEPHSVSCNMVRLLLRAGATFNPDKVCPFIRTVVEDIQKSLDVPDSDAMAIWYDDVDAMKKSIENGYVPTLSDLFSVIHAGNTKVTKLMLDMGLDANKYGYETDDDGNGIAIIYAGLTGQVDLVELLLDHGVGMTDGLNHSGILCNAAGQALHCTILTELDTAYFKPSRGLCPHDPCDGSNSRRLMIRAFLRAGVSVERRIDRMSKQERAVVCNYIEEMKKTL